MRVLIPTALTDAETDKLKRLAEGKNVLEIGSLLGYSTVILAQVAKHVISIDPHEGYPETAPKSTLTRYIENINEYGVAHRVTSVVSTWQDALAPGHNLYPYELVFIDVTGKYRDTYECLRHFAPEWGWSLKTIAVHDCGHPSWPGVDRAVKDFQNDLGIHALYEQVDRLGIFTYV